MKYAFGFAGGFAFAMLMHWIAGHEFVRGEQMALGIILGVLTGFIGVILVLLLDAADDIVRYDRERR